MTSLRPRLIRLQLHLLLILTVTVALVTPARAQWFNATPLTDFAPGELYLGKFPGLLYDGSNDVPTNHQADGIGFAGQVQPLDAGGNASPTGKIVVVGLGMSNWTMELCQNPTTSPSDCLPNTFFEQAARLPNVNPALVLVDCAHGGALPVLWADPSSARSR